MHNMHHCNTYIPPNVIIWNIDLAFALSIQSLKDGRTVLATN